MPHLPLLRMLGLSENEARAYCALLELGRGTVQDIARKSGLKRPTVYLILDQLRIKEAILQVPHAKRSIYIAKSPNEVYEKHVRSLQEQSPALATLASLYKRDQGTNMLYFEGVRGIEEALNYRLNDLIDTNLDGFWAKVDKWEPKVEEVAKKWNRTSHKLGIQIRALVPDHGSLSWYRSMDDAYGRRVKVLSEEKYSSDFGIEMTDLFVRITQFDTPQAIIIESEELSKTLRQIFQLVWDCIPDNNALKPS